MRGKAFEVRGLRKVYGSPEVVANDDLSFIVRPGEAFGLLGHNGAGKSTLVRQMVGLLRPTSGEIKLFGERVKGSGGRVARAVAYLPQGSLALGELTVEEAIRSTGMLRGLPGPIASHEASSLLDTLSLGDLSGRLVRKLSGGQRRLTQIGMTLIGHLPVLILDEPTADIDPALRRSIWELLIARSRAGAAVVLVTHDVAEAEHALDRVAILEHGRMLTQGKPADLKARLAHRTRIEVVVAEGRGDAALLAGDVAESASVSGRRVSAWVPADEAIRRLEKIVDVAGEGALEDVRLVTPTLEDVYLEAAGHTIAEDDAGETPAASGLTRSPLPPPAGERT